MSHDSLFPQIYTRPSIWYYATDAGEKRRFVQQ